MGSIEEEKLGFENISLTLSASESMNKQVQPLNCEVELEFPRGVSILRSIYIVLLKPKINALLLFGPLAILLHHFTSKQVRKIIPTTTTTCICVCDVSVLLILGF